MRFIIYEQTLKAKTKEEIEKNGKKLTLNKLLFEDNEGIRDSLIVFDNNLYLIMEEGKTYDLICSKYKSYINIDNVEEVKK